MREILDACQGLPERACAAGEVVMRDGTPAGALLVLAEGGVEVRKGDCVVATIEEPGAIFGEISVLLDTTHTATVVTTVPSRFWIVEDPPTFLRTTPGIALAVARLLARRLYAMTTYLVDLKRQFAQHADHLGIVDQVLDALTHAQDRAHDPGSDRDPDGNS